MEQFTKEKHVIIVKTHYKNGQIYAETARKLHGMFGRSSGMGTIMLKFCKATQKKQLST